MTIDAVPVVALLDANVLAGALTRNILLSLAEVDLFRPVWSDEILDEFVRYFVKRYDDPHGAHRQRAAMERAFPDARTDGFQHLLGDLANLPDAGDRHVVASAVHAGATVIVTENIKDFPAAILAGRGLEAIRLDDFVSNLILHSNAQAISALRTMRLRFNKPNLSVDALLAKIKAIGMRKSANILRDHKDRL